MTPKPQGGYYDDNFVLRNKFGLTDRVALARKERRQSQTKELRLQLGLDRIEPATPASARIRSLHRHLFSDVYEWAGEYREEGISKRPGDAFLPSTFILEAMAELDITLDTADGFADDPTEFFAQQFAELNYIHPFLDGNGRTQREFWRQYGADRGVTIDWTPITANGHQAAARAAADGDLGPLRKIFASVAKHEPDTESRRGGTGPRGPQARLRKGTPGGGQFTFGSHTDDGITL